MAWVRLDDGFWSNPKIIRLPDQAFRLYVSALCYSAEHLTDGFISAAADQLIRARISPTPRPLRAHRTTLRLVAEGAWEVTSGGYQIHDYLQYNKSREQVEHDRQRWRQYKGLRGGMADGSHADSTAVPRSPVPSRPVSLKNASSLQIDGDRTSDDDGVICPLCKGDAETEADRHADIRDRSRWVAARARTLHAKGTCAQTYPDDAPRQPRREFDLIDPDELLRRASARIMDVETGGAL